MMQLFYAPNSPYARKCRVVIREKGLEQSVEEVAVVTADNPAALLNANPLGTVPALRTEEGVNYCDSTVICEYLDALPSTKTALYPSQNHARIEALRLATMADGIMDAAVAVVVENRRPAEIRSSAWIERKEGALMRAIAALAKENLPDPSAPLSISSLSIACALDYVRFRLMHLNWQDTHPMLAIWLEDALNHSSLAATAPMP